MSTSVRATDILDRATVCRVRHGISEIRALELTGDIAMLLDALIRIERTEGKASEIARDTLNKISPQR